MGVTHHSWLTLFPSRCSTLKLIPSEFDSVISEHGRNIIDSWEHKEALSQSLPLPLRELSSFSLCSSALDGRDCSQVRRAHFTAWALGVEDSFLVRVTLAKEAGGGLAGSCPESQDLY